MASPSKSIAVLPFDSLSDKPDAHYFARGFAEDLIGKLTRFDSLRVVASQSSFATNDLDMPLKDIVEEWGWIISLTEAYASKTTGCVSRLDWFTHITSRPFGLIR